MPVACSLYPRTRKIGEKKVLDPISESVEVAGTAYSSVMVRRVMGRGPWAIGHGPQTRNGELYER